MTQQDDECAKRLETFWSQLRKTVSVPSNGQHSSRVEGGSTQSEAAFLGQTVRSLLDRGAPEHPVICQTGFNYGTSAFGFLCASDAISVYSFDIGQHEYVDEANKEISARFPDRHHLTIGDSTETLPKARSYLEGKCDFVFVDGGHSGDVPLIDIRNFQHLAKAGAMVMVDDCPSMVGVGKGWEEAKKLTIVEEDEPRWAVDERSICVGHYLGGTTPS